MRLLWFFLLVLPLTNIAQKTRPFSEPQGPTAVCFNIPGMWPTTAIPVCGATVFHQSNVSSCTGWSITNPTCGVFKSDNSFWYKFHCYSAGSSGLGFLITPDSGTDDFDWALFDITGHPDVQDLFVTPSMQVSVNSSGELIGGGVTGCAASGSGNVNCAGNTPQYNKLAPMIAGHDYMLMVSNWSNSGLGYGLSFTGGDAVITDNTLPVITSVAPIGCSSTKLKVVFSTDIRCSSVTPSGSEFSITPAVPTVLITSVTSQCTVGFNSITELTINFSSAIPGGSYTLNVNPGTDGNTFKDACDQDMLTGFAIPFALGSHPPPTITNISYIDCAPTVLDLTMSNPIMCSSITASGSDFVILPGNLPIASVQSSCGPTTYTSNIRINLQNPLPPGNYQLRVTNGTDGNPLVDTCGTWTVTFVPYPFTVNQVGVGPIIQSIVVDPCKPDQVIVDFDKPVRCGSLTAAGSEFNISPGIWNIASVTSNCSTQSYTSQVILNLQNPLSTGTYFVNINSGTDLNTIADSCLAFTTPGYSKQFSFTAPPAPIFDSVQFDRCAPSSAKLFYDHAIKCSSISVDGTDFTITGPSGVNIISATTDVTCVSGYTNWVLLQFASPVNAGNFTIHTGVGTDGNGIIDTCNVSQNVTQTIAMNVLGKPLPTFNSQVNWGCSGSDTIVLSHPGGNGINSWTWNFSDGTSASGQSVAHVFPSATPTVDIQLIVSNGFCSDSVTTTITLGNVFNASFSNNGSDTSCISTPVTFTNTSTGNNIVSYLWDFGDNSQFNGQNPPPHFFTSGNLYTTQLIVSDIHGCKDSASKQILVTALPLIDFTGMPAQTCTGVEINLTRKISHNITSYLWDNGDGKTFLDKPKVEFFYPNHGVYTITLTATDRYCAPVTVSKNIPVYTLPTVSLGPDTVLCPGTSILIGTPSVSGYTYSWNTGANSSQILTDPFTRKYSLRADNNGCWKSDEILVKVLSACLIRVPGAFTPNRDGFNDKLGALNADLAKSFSFKVFNRLGQLLFATNDPMAGWDGYYKGEKADIGTYVWMLSYIDPWTGKFVEEKGTSILLR